MSGAFETNLASYRPDLIPPQIKENLQIKTDTQLRVEVHIGRQSAKKQEAREVHPGLHSEH